MKTFKHLLLVILSTFLIFNYSFVDIHAEDNQIKYSTMYYLESLEGKYQMRNSETENNYGAVGETVTAHIKSFPGFVLDTSHTDSRLSGVLDVNGLQLDVYYKRDTHSVYFKDGDTVYKQYLDVKYETYLSSLNDKPTTATKTGYSFVSWDTNLDNTTVGFNDLVINANFNRNYYEVHIDPDGGVLSGVSSSETYFYNEEFTINYPKKMNAQFAGWEITGMDDSEHFFDGAASNDTNIITTATRFKNLTSKNKVNVSFKALWTTNPVKCVVNHYLMNDQGTSYLLMESENISGDKGSIINVDDYKKTFFGFEYMGGKGNNASPTILQNSFDTTVTVTQTDVYNINLYYSRNKHTLTIQTGDAISSIIVNSNMSVAGGEPGAAFENGKTFSYDFYYGQKIDLSAYSSGIYGYNLFWTKDNVLVNSESNFTYTMGDEDITLCVSSIKPSGHSYTIKHHLENFDGNGYTESIEHQDILFGEEGTSITAVGKNIPGFTYDSTNSNNHVTDDITNDDLMSLDLYYKRNTYNVFFRDGNSIVKKYEGIKYGTLISNLEDIPSAPTKTGYTFNGWGANLSMIYLQDHDLNLYANFTANTYNISYILDYGTLGFYQPTFTTYDKQFIVDNPIKKGYKFDGWTISGMDSNQHTIGTTTSTNNEVKSSATVFKNLTAAPNATITFTANWIADKTPYTVRHYQMDIDGKSYSLESIDTFNGSVDSTVNIDSLKKSYTGFTYEGGNAGETGSSVKKEPFNTEAILEINKPLVISLFYKRNKHNVSLSKGTGITAVYGAGEYYYGDTVYVSTNFKENYTFLNWTKDSSSMNNGSIYSFAMPDSDLSLKANAFSGDGSEYKIEHYKENLENNEYTLVDTESLTAPTGTSVTANDKIFTGFTFDSNNSNNKLSGDVLEDGSLVLKLYYKRNTHTVTFTDGNNNPLKVIENVKYDTTISNLSDIPTNPIKIGYAFKGWDRDLANTKLLDNDLTISAKFDANKYNISYVLNSGTLGTNQPVLATYDQQFTVDNPTRAGYNFDGWSIAGMDSNPHVIGAETTLVNTITTSATSFLNLHATNNATVTFTANWSEKPIEYVVNHLLMGKDGQLYDLGEVENFDGSDGAEITINNLKKTYTGFTYEGGKAADYVAYIKPSDFDTTATVELDKTLVINLYYSRNKNTITLTGDDGISSFAGDGEHYYDELVQITAIVKPGYTFLNWSDGQAAISNSNIYQYTMGDEDVAFTATTTANTNTHYIVKHMQQDVDGKNYTIKDSEELTGVTDSSVTPSVKTYIGFNSPETQTVTINGDGTTIVEYKYDRHSYTVNFDGDDATSGSIASHSIKFGQVYTLPNNPFVKTNNTFLIWKLEDIPYFIGASFTITEDFVTSHDLDDGDTLTFKAQWESNEPVTVVKETDFKAGEVKQVVSDKTEFNMKLASESLKNALGGTVAAAGSVVWLESKKTEDNDLKSSTKTIIEEKANLNCEIKECLDIKLFSQNKGEESKNIKDLSSAVKITFKLETQENVDAAKAGKLVIYSIHDGVLDPNMIVGTFNEATNEYTFDTNKFSIFALTYLPNGIPKPAGENDNSGKSQGGQEKFEPPRTGIY